MAWQKDLGMTQAKKSIWEAQRRIFWLRWSNRPPAVRDRAFGRTRACSGARESVFAVIGSLRRAPADA
jgi:hypothetical protein